MEPRDPENPLKDALMRDEIRAAIEIWSRLLDGCIGIRTPDGTVFGNIELLQGKSIQPQVLEVCGRNVEVYSRFEGTHTSGIPRVKADELFRQLLEEAYKVEDLAASLLDFFEYRDRILGAVKQALRFPRFPYLVHLFLNQVIEVCDVEYAFAAVRYPMSEQPIFWTKRKEEDPKLVTLPLNGEEFENKLLSLEGGKQTRDVGTTIWKPGGDRPVMLNEVFRLPAGESACTCLIRLSERRPFGIVGVSAAMPDGWNSVKIQWIDIFTSVMSGAIATAACQEAEKAQAKAEALAEAFRRTSARAAHMIKNPTFFMMGELDSLREDVERARMNGNETIGERIASLYGYAKRIERITIDFQQFAQKSEVSMGPANLEAAVREVMNAVFSVSSNYQVTLRFPKPSPVLRLDPQKFRSVLEEIFGNAIRFMPKGGALEITCEGPHAPGTPPFREWNKPHILLTIADTGPGVPSHAKDRIFEPFFTTRADGTGLGLAIVKEYCEAMGCRVKEDGPGESGRGARFRIGILVEVQEPSATGN